MGEMSRGGQLGRRASLPGAACLWFPHPPLPEDDFVYLNFKFTRCLYFYLATLGPCCSQVTDPGEVAQRWDGASQPNADTSTIGASSLVWLPSTSPGGSPLHSSPLGPRPPRPGRGAPAAGPCRSQGRAAALEAAVRVRMLAAAGAGHDATGRHRPHRHFSPPSPGRRRRRRRREVSADRRAGQARDTQEPRQQRRRAGPLRAGPKGSRGSPGAAPGRGRAKGGGVAAERPRPRQPVKFSASRTRSAGHAGSPGRRPGHQRHRQSPRRPARAASAAARLGCSMARHAVPDRLAAAGGAAAREQAGAAARACRQRTQLRTRQPHGSRPSSAHPAARMVARAEDQARPLSALHPMTRCAR